MPYHFGKFLKNQADKINFSAEELAQKINKTESTVYADFRKADLNTKVLIQYCKALELNPGEVMEQFFPKEEAEQPLGGNPLNDAPDQKIEHELRQEAIRLNQWLSDREELIRLYRSENGRLQTELDNCLQKLKEKPGQMAG